MLRFGNRGSTPPAPCWLIYANPLPDRKRGKGGSHYGYFQRQSKTWSSTLYFFLTFTKYNFAFLKDGLIRCEFASLWKIACL
jgi:hypothetical protein